MRVTDGRLPVPEMDPWDTVTFEGAELASLRRAARMTFRERLEWLEQATELAYALQHAKKRPLAETPAFQQPRSTLSDDAE